MRGARGCALLAGILFIVVGIWQIVLNAGAPAATDEWLRFMRDEPMLGKTWGLRIVALLIAIAPLRSFGERAEGGWGVAARGFLTVWLPLVLAACLIQTQSLERLRGLVEEMTESSQLTVVAFTMWHALVEPFTRTSAVIGVLGFGFLVASLGGRGPVLGVAFVLVFVLLTALRWSPVMDGVITLAEGLILAVLAFAFPREPDSALLA